MIINLKVEWGDAFLISIITCLQTKDNSNFIETVSVWIKSDSWDLELV